MSTKMTQASLPEERRAKKSNNGRFSSIERRISDCSVVGDSIFGSLVPLFAALYFGNSDRDNGSFIGESCSSR
jgi:hypothetical protein